jgi:hypothetical protein
MDRALLMQRSRWLFGVVVWLLTTAFLSAQASADDPNQVGLVVVLGEGQVETYCIAFEEDVITGADLLARSGLDVVIDPSSGMGPTVCQIEGLGCAYPSEACFCQCTGGGGCTYWNYFYRNPDAEAVSPGWVYSALGVASRKVSPGAVEAWVWGDGHSPPADELDFEAICAPPTATPEPSAPALATETVAPIESEPSVEASTLTPTITLAATRKPLRADVTPGADEAGTRRPAGAAATPSPRPPATAAGSSSASRDGAAFDSAQVLFEYWPFGLMLVGLGVFGLLVWMRRR